MANFTDEARVRLKTQLTDTAKIPQELVTRSIDDAHAEILKRLDPAYDVTPPDDNLVRGETLLAGAYLLRSLSPGAAFDIKGLRILDETVSETGKYKALMTLAERFDKDAWEVLSDFLLSQQGRADFQSGVTETEEILGETDGD
ncbi:MAG: hypothetical protein KAJ01_04505 [Candidatus Hydrogenedentes bacterium]|nr:hypothetical protein [Candidatus Hydrogenedentota bacterium]